MASQIIQSLKSRIQAVQSAIDSGMCYRARGLDIIDRLEAEIAHFEQFV